MAGRARNHTNSLKQNFNKAQNCHHQLPLSIPEGWQGTVRYMSGLAWLWVTTHSEDLAVSPRKDPEEFKSGIGGEVTCGLSWLRQGLWGTVWEAVCSKATLLST